MKWIKPIIMLLLTLPTLLACSSSTDKAYKQGKTIECRVERGLFFGGNYTIDVNNKNSKPARKFGAHGQSIEIYKLENGIEVKRANCKLV
ncbi:hypothetical protein [Thiomicrospira microaerophila]|uniref:hypothetical protein n=1 Tax=Thiomicrospira microaerophila TaxID=406020 RepID=UPI0005C99669|nr:hypothetical protein [Thiomicrospira microaerophila]